MILVLGATGFLGKRVCRKLSADNVEFEKSSLSLGTDLQDLQATIELFERVKPTYILNCASFVGGIQFGMKHPVELFSNNLKIISNIYEAAQKIGIKRIVNPISNCTYPGDATLFKEDEWWDGPMHESVMVYGFARKAVWMGAWAYHKQYGMDIINIILSNMYGPEDHFEEERSHALGALVMKFVKAKQQGAKQVIVWGTGTPVREWLHIDDGAQAMITALEIEATIEPINIGVASGITIKDMALQIKAVTGFEGDLHFDTSKADGAPYKTVDGTKGKELLKWQPSIDFATGLKQTIDWYIENQNKL
ncbi:MAG: NAD-dependent epimerase/dehydratase family protein [OCS116 cluster bacterium]|nr:NAD-dependent epimerase/dehydratase family protein [OCS116 cluster bacterium]